MRNFTKALVLGIVLSVSACALNPDQASRDRLGVQVATMTLIERADDPGAKALKVVGAVREARTLLDRADTSVSVLRAALLERIAERSPPEKLVALEVINAVSDEVERRLGSGLLQPDQRVSVNTVLSWVEDTASLYVPQ